MQQKNLHLPWPQNKIPKHAIYPIFIPFAGCAKRCIFCAQHLQSGNSPCEDHDITQHVLATARQDLMHRQSHGESPLELAFYGGTFTALPDKDFATCVRFTKEELQAGRITGARCSTRPDSINLEKFLLLKSAGFHTIELGIQSFHTKALHKAHRHYTQDVAKEACALVKQAGFTLGVQLMPGMPGVDEAIFLADTALALEAGADFLRMYPCQVIAGTRLEELWHRGEFTPWTLQATIDALSKAWLTAHLRHIPVIRMGLAPQKDLEQNIVAGPRHEALGNLVQSEALYHYIARALQDEQKNTFLKKQPPVQSISLPEQCQGYFWGHKHHLTERWHNLDITKKHIIWNTRDFIEIAL